MLLREWSGFRSLPSRYGGGEGGLCRRSMETTILGLPGRETERTEGSLGPFSQSLLAAELERSNAGGVLSPKIPSPSKLCLLGGGPDACEERNLALELDMMQFELRSLKQKMESSFIHLEKEKKWLEMMSSEGRKRRGDAEEKVETELAKVTPYFGQRDQGSPSRESSQNGTGIQEKPSVGHELRNLQEGLAALKECIKTLERKREEMGHQLKSVKKGDWISTSRLTEAKQTAAEPLESRNPLQEERSPFLVAYNSIKLQEKDQLQQRDHELNLKLKPALAEREIFFQEKVALHQQLHQLTLELEFAQKKQKEFSGQILAISSELARAKIRVSQKEQEKDLMSEELGSLRQSNRELSSEVAEGHQKLQAASEKLRRLEEEKTSRDERLQFLEVQQAQLMEVKALQRPQILAEEQCHESRTFLRESCDRLRESQIQLQREKDLLQARCRDLERQTEDFSRRLDEQRSDSQHWRKRWEQLAEALKTKENEQEQMGTQSQALFAKVVSEEANPDLALAREPLQAAWEQLKSYETALEEQRRELEAARIQKRECQAEKQELAELVCGLEEQLAEKDRALRELKQAQVVHRAVLETRRSSAELKDELRGLDAKVLGNPQQELEGLKQQHHLVTEELKGLFRQRQQQLADSKKLHDGPSKEDNPVPFRKVQGLLVANESVGLSEESHRSAFKSDAAQNLQDELKANTETISAMACEIQELKEKNENLTKAKLRFQQQIREIQKLSTQQPKKSHGEPQVPGLSVGLREDLQRERGSESAVLLPQSEVAQVPLQGSKESQQGAVQEQQLHIFPEVKEGHASSDAKTPWMSSQLLPSNESLQPHKCLPDTPEPPHQLFLTPVASPKEPWNRKSEEVLLSPHNSGIVSPRPFGAPRIWSPFRENAESPEDRKEL